MRRNNSFKGLLNDEEIKNPGPKREFGKRLLPALRELFAPMGRVEPNRTKEINDWLYSLAEEICQVDNMLAMYRATESRLRQSGDRYRRALIAVGHCLDSLSKAEALMQKEFEAGLNKREINLHTPRTGLVDLQKDLQRLQSQIAALIHFDLRTDLEKKVAPSAPKWLHPIDFAVNEGSAEVRHRAAVVLKERLTRFTNGRVSDTRINAFIAEFLDAVLHRIEPGTVKTILHRSSAKKKNSSD
jgi:hypothetical protein